MASTLGMDTIYGSIPGVTSDLGHKLGDPFSGAFDSADMPVPIAAVDAMLR